jgi:alkanesulfonate monooxygenase SsuD/methylene tetrahydromethanopterin reductase-like flavin-dependent oxidoreductase (luciferase family)
MTSPRPLRLGFFTRLLDVAPPPSATASARSRSSMPSAAASIPPGSRSIISTRTRAACRRPSSSSAHVAARTSRIRLGTGIVTLPLELPVRVAEDAAVLDLMSGEPLELGVGPGGNASAFTAFGLDSAERGRIFGRNHADAEGCAGGKTAAGRRPSLSGGAGTLDGPHVAGDLHRRGRAPRRRRRRRPAALAHPAAPQGRSRTRRSPTSRTR